MNRPARLLAAAMLAGMAATAWAAELELHVHASPDPVMPGEMLETFITVANRSLQASDAVRIEMPYPAGLRSLGDGALSDGGDCSNVDVAPGTCSAGETLFWQIASLAAGAAATVSLTPIVADGASGSISFAAQVFEDAQLRDGDSHAVPVVDARTLGVAIDPASDPVRAGDRLRYTLVYGNRAGHSFAGTLLRFTPPIGTTLVAASGDGVMVGDDVVWDLSTLPDRLGGRRSVELQVDDLLPAGSLLVAAATLRGEADFSIDEARARSAVRVAAPTLQLTIGTAVDPLRPTLQVPTEVTVINRTDTLIADVAVDLLLPAGLAALEESAVLDGAGCSDIDVAPGLCGDGERLTWPVGPLPPNGGQTLLMAPRADSSTRTPADGSLLALNARARHAGAATAARARYTARVDDGRRLQLAIDPAHAPLVAGDTLGYELVFGNRGAAPMPQAELRLILPAGTTPLAMPADAIRVGDELRWSLGTLAGNSGGRRTVQLQLAPDALAGGRIVYAQATLRGVDQFVPHEAHAAVGSRVEPAIPLSLQVTPSADAVQPRDPLDTMLTVQNVGDQVHFNVTLRLLFAQPMAAVADSAIGDGGDCNNVDVAPNSCGPGETVSWNVGALAPGEQRIVALPAVIRSSTGAPDDGSLIRLLASASSDSFGRATDSATVLVAAATTRPDLIFHDGFEPPP